VATSKRRLSKMTSVRRLPLNRIFQLLLQPLCFSRHLLLGCRILNHSSLAANLLTEIYEAGSAKSSGRSLQPGAQDPGVMQAKAVTMTS